MPHPCSASIGRLPCPCDGFQDEANTNVCDVCSHSLSHHISPPTFHPMPNLPQPIAGPTSTQTRSVSALFQALLKSTPGGSLAIQETSNMFRKSGTSSAAVVGVSLNTAFQTISNLCDRLGAPLVCEANLLFKPRTPALPFGFARLFLLHVALRQMNR